MTAATSHLLVLGNAVSPVVAVGDVLRHWDPSPFVDDDVTSTIVDGCEWRLSGWHPAVDRRGFDGRRVHVVLGRVRANTVSATDQDSKSKSAIRLHAYIVTTASRARKCRISQRGRRGAS